MLIFPGSYDLEKGTSWLSNSASLIVDVAYDVENFEHLKVGRQLSAILISTSSELFTDVYGGQIEALKSAVMNIGASALVFKENRGGSRLYDFQNRAEIPLYAQHGETANSVGVGDVFASSFLVHIEKGLEVAGYRATAAATAYSRTTYPDDFKTQLNRYSKLSISELRELGGVHLPWEARRKFDIYLAAPDFSYQDNPEIDRALESLEYHNFRIRRPVVENGELPTGSTFGDLRKTFHADFDLLKGCAIVFAIPNSRDAGTLVEMGMAMSLGIPVITFDPRKDAANTMVIAGSKTYSQSLDTCLNSVFTEISKIWTSCL